MTGKQIYKIWAPAGAAWTRWVRPVAFVSIDDSLKTIAIHNVTPPPLNYINQSLTDTAIIVDLPNYDSVMEGVALAGIGFRPIPLYNGTNEPAGARALVDNHGIKRALVWGALKLKNIEIAANASPAFLLDSNRMHRFKMSVSVFDNSWDLYDQDIPSAEYFLDHGIRNIIVRSERIHSDLNKILYKFQKKGITILFTKGYELPRKVLVRNGKIRR